MRQLARRALSRLAETVLGGRLAEETVTPCAALYYNPALAEWLVEPVDVMKGRASIHNWKARERVSEDDAARLPAVIKRAMRLCRVLEPGPAPRYPGWSKFIREHHLIYAYRSDQSVVVEPWVRHHAGGGGSYTPLVERDVSIPAESPDKEVVLALRTALERARSEEEAW